MLQTQDLPEQLLALYERLVDRRLRWLTLLILSCVFKWAACSAKTYDKVSRCKVMRGCIDRLPAGSVLESEAAPYLEGLFAAKDERNTRFALAIFKKCLIINEGLWRQFLEAAASFASTACQYEAYSLWEEACKKSPGLMGCTLQSALNCLVKSCHAGIVS